MTHKRWFTPWLLVVPAGLWLVVFNVWPAINTLILSFTNAKALGGGQFTGLANYERLLDDGQLVNALLNSIVYMIVFLPLLTLLPLLLAVLV